MNISRTWRHNHFAFPLVALIAVLLLVISELSYRQAVTSLDDLGRMATVRVNNLMLLRLVVDAESGQRGYLLTGREEYLQPYNAAVSELRRVMAELDAYYRHDPHHRSHFVELNAYVERKVSEMSSSLKMFREGNTQGALQLMLTDIGREQMEAVRSASHRLIEIESQKIAAERGEVYATLRLGRLGVAAMTALSLLALLMYLRQRSAIEALRLDQQKAVERERDQLEALARERTEQLTELARHLQTAREDERSRLARDLHDELGALLTAAKLDVARLKSRIPEITPEAAARMAHLNETLNSGIALKRRIIEDLRPSSLSNLGLIAALEIQAREFGDSSGLKVDIELEPVRWTPSSELTAYRLVQEALTNIGKYAKASRVTIRLQAHGDAAEISVEDDGIGFDPEASRRSAHGLLGMRFRVEAEGGRMQLRSAPAQGTRISARMPLAPEPEVASEPSELQGAPAP
jgi:signal transduction histidine kinase